MKCLYDRTPSAGTSNASGIVSTRSGLPSAQPLGQSIGLGRSFASPFGMPASTQAASVSISSCVSRRSLAKWPWRGSACHGGMRRCTLTSRTIRPWRAASS
jgi:hypothetical protein